MLFGSISSAVLSVSALVGAVFLWKKRAEGGIQKLICGITGTNNNIVQHMNTALVCIMRENIRQLCEKCLKSAAAAAKYRAKKPANAANAASASGAAKPP